MKDKFIKVALLFIFVSVAISLTSSQMDNMIGYSYRNQDCWSCFQSAPAQTISIKSNAMANNQNSSPLAFLFQIMFILFFISPPIIAFMLFLIWKELKERNRMK